MKLRLILNSEEAVAQGSSRRSKRSANESNTIEESQAPAVTQPASLPSTHTSSHLSLRLDLSTQTLDMQNSDQSYRSKDQRTAVPEPLPPSSVPRLAYEQRMKGGVHWTPDEIDYIAKFSAWLYQEHPTGNFRYFCIELQKRLPHRTMNAVLCYLSVTKNIERLKALGYKHQELKSERFLMKKGWQKESPDSATRGSPLLNEMPAEPVHQGTAIHPNLEDEEESESASDAAEEESTTSRRDPTPAPPPPQQILDRARPRGLVRTTRQVIVKAPTPESEDEDEPLPLERPKRLGSIRGEVIVINRPRMQERGRRRGHPGARRGRPPKAALRRQGTADEDSFESEDDQETITARYTGP